MYVCSPLPGFVLQIVIIQFSCAHFCMCLCVASALFSLNMGIRLFCRFLMSQVEYKILINRQSVWFTENKICGLNFVHSYCLCINKQLPKGAPDPRLCSSPSADGMSWWIIATQPHRETQMMTFATTSSWGKCLHLVLIPKTKV